MIAYISLDQNGYVTGTGFTSSPLKAGEDLRSPDQKNPHRFQWHYLKNNILVPRPKSPEPEEIEGGWVIRNCKAGTLIEVFDLLGQESICELTAEGDVEFTLPDAGMYRVDVSEILPAYPTKTMIEVT